MLAWCSISVRSTTSPGDEVGAAPGVGHQVQGLGGVLGEHHLAGRVGRADEPPDGQAGVLVEAGGLLGRGVDAAVDVGVGGLVVALHRRRGPGGAGAPWPPSPGRRWAGSWTVRARSGKSLRTASTSRAAAPAPRPPPGPGRRRAGPVHRRHRAAACRGRHLSSAIRRSPRPRSAGPAPGRPALDHPAVHQQVDLVRHQVLQDALVVGDHQHAETRGGASRTVCTPRPTTRSASMSSPESVSSSTARRRLEQRHLEDLVALLLAAGEPLVQVALAEGRVHAEALHPLGHGQADLQHREVVAAPGRHGLAEELDHRHPVDRLGVLEGQEHARPWPGRRWTSG